MSAVPGRPKQGRTRCEAWRLPNVPQGSLRPRGGFDTELQSHIADERVRERLRDTRQSVEWLRPEDIAEWVCYAVCQPPRVNLAQIAVLPTQQPV